MKQELTVQGRVELSREEVAEAAMNFVSNEKKLTKAIDAWLATKHNLSSVKIRYSKDDEGISKAVVDVKRKIVDKTITRFSDDPKIERSSTEGHVRTNIGVFKFIKEYLHDESKKGQKKLDFLEVLEMVKFAFPSMDESRLAVYLHDKRMLPNVKFSRRDNIVNFS